MAHSNPTVFGQQVWGKIKGSMDTWHEQGMRHLHEIIRAPGIFAEVNMNGIHFIEKRLPDGRGARLDMDYSFKGFVD